jgi:hypothetical protein
MEYGKMALRHSNLYEKLKKEKERGRGFGFTAVPYQYPEL